jgi:hypothetical protein
MTMDSVIRVEDIPLPTGVVAEADPDTPVVTVLVMRTAAAEAEEAADEAAAEEASAESASDAPESDDE